jgi:phosphopantothenoylcysteine synthetase/decarboxylase
MSRRQRLLLGVTGSVAAVKWESLCLALHPYFDLRVVLTESGSRFDAAAYSPQSHGSFAALLATAGAAGGARGAGGSGAGDERGSNNCGGGNGGGASASGGLPPAEATLAILRDRDEWAGYSRVGLDAVVHIELRKWADVLLVAPCSANTLAKLAGGLADNLLTCAARAWEFGEGGRVAKPFLVAPAMNTAMWAHPATAAHLGVLSSWGVGVIPPVEKVLACGDRGVGAMAEVDCIVQACCAAVGQKM